MAASRTAPERLSVADVVAATGIPVELWIADCFGISLAILDRGLVNGRVTGGFYKGPVHPDSPFRPPIDRVPETSSPWLLEIALGVSCAPAEQRWAFAQGFIALDDGRVLDATRWTYELVPPYIHVGPADEYEETTDPDELWYAQHVADELQSGGRQPYDGSLRVCAHDSRARRQAATYLRLALSDPWWRPLHELAQAAA